MIFDEVVFFTDTGFMEGGQDVPALPYTSGGVTVDNLSITDAQCLTYGNLTVDDVVVQKATAFTEMKVPVTSIVDAMRWTYLRAKMTTPRRVDPQLTVNETKHVYGWVDSVEVITSADYDDDTHIRNVRVRWHIDLWRTYGGSASFGRGTIKRQKSHVHPQKYTYVQRIIDSDLSQRLVVDENKLGWCITVYNTESSDNTSNNLVVLCIPFMKEGGSRMTMVLAANAGLGLSEKRGYGVSKNDIYTGKVGEIYGLAPSQIVGSWVCLTELFKAEKTNVDEYTYDDPSLHNFYLQKTYDNDVFMGLKFTLSGFNNYIWPGRSITFTVDDGGGNQVPAYLGTTDRVEARVIAADGSAIEVLPEGFTFNTCRILVDVSATAAYYILRFNTVKSDYAGWTSKSIDNEDSNAYGFECHIPMDSVPVAANSWSEYAFSADRQYDIDSRVAQQEIAYTKNLLGIGTSALSGGVVGGMSGNPVGAVVGSIVGLIGGTAESVGGKMTDEAWNGTLQDLEDRRAAGQHEGIALPGGGYLWFTSERMGMTLEIFAMDAVTQANITASETINGFTCDVPSSDCSGYFDVPSGESHPLQIADLEVTGPIPNAARNYIRGRLAAGVRMVQGTRWS